MASEQASKLSQNGEKLTLCGSRPIPGSCQFTGAMVPEHLRSTRATRPAHTHRLPEACAPATQESAMMKSGRPPTTSANPGNTDSLRQGRAKLLTKLWFSVQIVSKRYEEIPFNYMFVQD
jgi:hypothetical protein